MHAAQVFGPQQAPKYVEIPDEPSPADGQLRIKMLSMGLHNVVRGRASGEHYTSSSFPLVPGIDGVGRIDSGPNSGRLAYINALRLGKSFQDILNVPENDVHLIPDDSDPVHFAALLNPAIASWMAVTRRTSNLPENFTALVLGATTMSGRIAVTVLRSLGASTVFGLARNEEAMKTLGFDRTIVLKDNAGQTDFGDLSKVDLVHDFLFGAPALATIKALPAGHRVQYVHIGSVAGMELTLDYSCIRSRDIVMTGSGIGAWGGREISQELPRLLKVLPSVPKQDAVKAIHLKDVEDNWANTKDRIAFVTDNYSVST